MNVYEEWRGPIRESADDITDEDIDNQDNVDNLIQDLLFTLSFTCNNGIDDLPWNINTISAVREIIRLKLWENHGIHIPYAEFKEDE